MTKAKGINGAINAEPLFCDVFRAHIPKTNTIAREKIGDRNNFSADHDKPLWRRDLKAIMPAATKPDNSTRAWGK